jgi:uncharacterized protein
VRSIFRKTLFENFIVFACEQGFPAPGGEVILNSRPTKMAERATDQEFVEFVVKQIVNNPDNVKVERKIDEMGVLITLDVNPEDMGMIIGREGATAKALRTLLRVIGAKNNARVNLKINEPEGSEKRERPEKRSIEDVVGDINV